jgi:hypothetical protein
MVTSHVTIMVTSHVKSGHRPSEDASRLTAQTATTSPQTPGQKSWLWFAIHSAVVLKPPKV